MQSLVLVLLRYVVNTTRKHASHTNKAAYANASCRCISKVLDAYECIDRALEVTTVTSCANATKC